MTKWVWIIMSDYVDPKEWELGQISDWNDGIEPMQVKCGSMHDLGSLGGLVKLPD